MLLKRRLAVLVATAALVVMMLAMAMPALAAKPAPTREECLAVQRAINEGERLTGQQLQLIRQFGSLGECIAASEG